jgi:hypothetical protein
MILQAVSEIDEAQEDDAGTGNEETNGSGSVKSFNYSVTQKIRDTIPKIRAIVCDIDGTLLSADHVLHSRTLAAAASTSEPLQHFFQPRENRERVR